MAMGYASELKSVFAQPKYATMEELMQIRKNQHKKKAVSKREKVTKVN
jgi:hypothetical protein